MNPDTDGIDHHDTDTTAHASSSGVGDHDNGWNVGIDEDTGNTVSAWPGGRYYDNLTWDPVEPE